ncbi:MAG: beta-phosphoglucomutase, partial [Termitinemataceae bacterium]
PIWRTIDGEETSAYYPAGTAQYHINADIVYAIEKYVSATGDRDFLYSKAAEIAAETARLWCSLGHFGQDGKFRIDCVTGPDEYTALVNNNAYTNLMARNNLLFAVQTLTAMQHEASDAFAQLAARIHLNESELETWRRAATNMYIPFDSKGGIIPQDDSFLNKERWPFEDTPKNKYPLLLHYHPLVIYRHQVLKQPDVVLAQFLLSEQFSLAEKIRNFDFYEPLTTGDSSLSHCIQSIMAAETGQIAKAYDYFLKTVRMDLDDIHGNSRDGIHVASMAGSWLSVMYGFAGFRDRPLETDGIRYSFNPDLPSGWKRLKFALRTGAFVLSVDVGQQAVLYSLQEGGGNRDPSPVDAQLQERFVFKHRGRVVSLKPGESLTVSLKPVLRAVLFDLDGVITDTARLHYAAWKHLADEQGWAFDEGVNEKLKGVSRLESLDIILRHNRIKLDEGIKQDLADRKNRYYLELLQTLRPQDILPGILDLLTILGQRGIKRIIASASRNAAAILGQLGLGPVPGPYFEGIVDPATVCCGKPDPELFLKAAQLAQADIQDCVGIEDSQAGIDALGRACIQSIGIGTSLKGASVTVSDTGKLSIALLEKVVQTC